MREAEGWEQALRHKHTNCIEGKRSIHIPHCAFLSYSLANKGCFSFQGTTDI